MFNKLFLLVIVLLIYNSINAQAQPPDTIWTRYTHDIVRLQFSADDNTIMTVGQEGDMIFFDTQTGTPLKTLVGNGEYSADGTMIIASHGTTINIFNAQTYDSLQTITIPGATGNYGVHLSPDGQLIAAVGNSDVYFIDFQTGAMKQHLTQFGDETRAIRISSYIFTKDSKDLILTMGDPIKGSYGELMYINTQTYQMDYRNDCMPKYLAISNDGTMLAFNSLTNGYAITIMNTQTHTIINNIPGNESSICDFAFSFDNKYFGISNFDNFNFNIYNANDFSLKTMINPGFCFIGIAFTKDNQFIAAGGGWGLQLIKFLTTGVQQQDNNSQNIIYPNPTDNTINISFNLPISENLNFNLYDISGKLISNLKNRYYNAGQIQEKLQLGNISIGSYFLKIESLQFNKTFQIIINK